VFVYGNNVRDAYCKANPAILNLYKWFNATKLSLNFERSYFGRVDVYRLYTITLESRKGACSMYKMP